jgi:hypothetical protein
VTLPLCNAGVFVVLVSSAAQGSCKKMPLRVSHPRRSIQVGRETLRNPRLTRAPFSRGLFTVVILVSAFFVEQISTHVECLTRSLPLPVLYHDLTI